MNSQQEKKLALYEELHRLCEAHRDTWSTLPAAVPLFDRFAAALAELQPLPKQHEKSFRFLARQRQEMCRKVLLVAKAIGAGQGRSATGRADQL